MKKRLVKSSINIDKELIIILLLVAIAGFIYFFIVNQRAFLNVFYLPVLLGAYFFGKRYALASAAFSVVIIFFLAYAFPKSFTVAGAEENAQLLRWLDLVTWALFLVFTGYCMGLLYDKKEEAKKELQRTYSGIIEMLSLVIESADNYTQSHSHRVSVIAEMIAKRMKLSAFEIENIRVAALLHDLGKIGVSEAVLQKVTSLSEQERQKMKQHAWLAVNMLEPLGETVGDILPIILHHHEKYDGSGYYKAAQDDIPLGARVIAVADVYDALTTDRPYRKAFSSLQAKQEILTNSGTHFDPEVVKAFILIYPYLETEIHLAPAKLNTHNS